MATNVAPSLWSDLRREPGDSRPPGPLVIGIVFAAQLGLVGAAQVAALPAIAAGIAVVAVAVVASWWLTLPSAAWLAGITVLVVNGFVEGSLGQLSWHGVTDVYLVLGVALGCALVAELRRDLRHRAPAASRGIDVKDA